MKKIAVYLLIISSAGIISLPSCKKERSCEGCNENKPPIAIAGPDQVITLPTDSISLDGSASNDPDGTISVWLWKKISGPVSFNVINTSSSKTVVKNLVTGLYQFELKVTDDKGLSANDTMQVIVDAVITNNHPPVANAGADQTITLPTNTITLNGSASIDPDNNITSYLWTKISGPSLFNISNVNTVQTQVINLEQGVYKFELKVTDAGGLFSKDTMQVSVNPVLNQPCVPNTLLQAPCDNIMRPVVCAQLIPFGNLSVARSSMATATAGNKIFFAGSGYPSSESSTVDIYDLTTQTWSVADLSAPRYDIAAVASGNKVFFGGGGTYQTWQEAVDVVDVYDVSTNTWTVTHLSAAGTRIAAAAVGDKVFFAGGDQESSGSDRPVKVDILNLTANTWSTYLLSEGRSRMTAVTANNKIYFAGGSGDYMGSGSSTIYIYDNVTNSWTTSSLTESKHLLAGIAIDDKIYWGGGYTNNVLSCTVEIKDLNNGSTSIQHLFKPGAFVMNTSTNAVAKDNKIVFFRNPEPFVPTAQNDKFDIYDITTNTWSIGVLPVSINMASFISVNNTIYVAGGCINGVLSNQVWKLEF